MAKHTFRSRGTQHRHVRIQHVEGDGPTGRKITLQRGLTYEFAPDGVLEVRDGQDVLPDGPNGESQDAVAWLRAHPQFNEYVTEDGNEPGIQRPTVEEIQAAIVHASVGLDAPCIERIAEQERASHNRPAVLKALAEAGDAIAMRRGELEATAAAEAPVVPQPAPVVPTPAAGDVADVGHGAAGDPPPPPPSVNRQEAPAPPAREPATRPAARPARRAAASPRRAARRPAGKRRTRR